MCVVCTINVFICIFSGFDVDVDTLPEEEMRSFFSKAGISDSQLQDHATRQFIYDFIYKNGGLDAVKEELHDVKPPAVRGRTQSAAGDDRVMLGIIELCRGG